MNETINQNELIDALNKWEDEYKPIKNHLDDNASWSGSMFETYGDELAFVLTQPEEHIWTWTSGDDGSYLNAGYAIVNRLGYIITEKPWTDPCHVLQVDIEGETCDECGDETENGFGHYQEELGYDHPRGEDRLCEECYLAIKEETENTK